MDTFPSCPCIGVLTPVQNSSDPYLCIEAEKKRDGEVEIQTETEIPHSTDGTRDFFLMFPFFEFEASAEIPDLKVSLTSCSANTFIPLFHLLTL